MPSGDSRRARSVRLRFARSRRARVRSFGVLSFFEAGIGFTFDSSIWSLLCCRTHRLRHLARIHDNQLREGDLEHERTEGLRMDGVRQLEGRAGSSRNARVRCCALAGLDLEQRQDRWLLEY